MLEIARTKYGSQIKSSLEKGSVIGANRRGASGKVVHAGDMQMSPSCAENTTETGEGLG